MQKLTTQLSSSSAEPAVAMLAVAPEELIETPPASAEEEPGLPSISTL